MNRLYWVIALSVASAILVACAAPEPDSTPAPGTVAVHMGGRMTVFGGAASSR